MGRGRGDIQHSGHANPMAQLLARTEPDCALSVVHWLPIPCRYDKSAFAGRGDRADPASWPVVSGPLELVFFEGWMLGFSPVADDAAGAVEAALQEVNRQLGPYAAAWDSLVDAWLVVRMADPQVCCCQDLDWCKAHIEWGCASAART